MVIIIRKIVSVLITIVMLMIFSSCNEITYNNISVDCLNSVEQNGKHFIQSKFSYVYSLDMEKRVFSRVPNEEIVKLNLEWESEPFFEAEFFAGEYQNNIPDGFEGVVRHIESFDDNDEESIYYAYGYLNDDVLVGFVQVYSEAAGLYGNYAIEYIEYSLIFEYQARTDAFVIKDKMEGAVIVAVRDNIAIYWKNEAYYSYDRANGTVTYLVDDKAYDSGLQQHSWGQVLSNDEHCIIHLNKVNGNDDNEYMYVYDFATHIFYELTYSDY